MIFAGSFSVGHFQPPRW